MISGLRGAHQSTPAIAERTGDAPSDTKTMDILLRLGPLTAGELGEHTGLATASVTSLIDRLEKKGLACRVVSKQVTQMLQTMPPWTAWDVARQSPAQDGWSKKR
jgi:hypothetical protein